MRVQGDVLGDGHWVVDGSASVDALLMAHRSFEAATLIGRGGEVLWVNLWPYAPNYVFIVDLLELDGAVFYQNHGRLLMEEGSVIRLTGGGNVAANSDMAHDFSYLGSVEYGLGGDTTNVLSSGWGVSFADPDSVLRGIDGPSSELTIEALGGGVGIASKVHQEAADWDASGVSLEIYVAGFTGLEANSPNLGGIWFADSPCIKPWGRLDVWGPLSEPLELIDDEDNSHPDVLAGTGGREAVYVDGDVTLHDGGSLEHNGLMVYLTGEMMPSCPPPPPPPQLPPICPMNVVQTLYGDFNNDCEIWPVELIELRQVISGIRPYGPIYDFDCDAEVTNEVELQQLVYNINYGVFPCAEQPPDGDGDDGDRSLTVVAFDEVELLETADWLAQNLDVAELEDLAATFQAGAEKYAGTPVGNQFALLADALGD